MTPAFLLIMIVTLGAGAFLGFFAGWTRGFRHGTKIARDFLQLVESDVRQLGIPIPRAFEEGPKG